MSRWRELNAWRWAEIAVVAALICGIVSVIWIKGNNPPAAVVTGCALTALWLMT